jgi:hypothetical protein
VLGLIACFLVVPFVAGAGEPGATVKGEFVANGAKVELPYAYAYAEKEGFYDASDPAWTLLFAASPIEERDLDDHIWDAPYIRLKVTRTAEFGDEPEIQVYSQDIRFSADQPGNVSGGTYPKIELTAAGPDRFAGRVHHDEPQTIFDDTFQYDFVFDLPMSDPFGPIGDPLPAGGGEPGAAYLSWCKAVLAGDMGQLKALMPPEQAAMLDDPANRESFAEDLEFMQMMTPTEVEILDGSSDGETAILHVTGVMEGETVRGEITLTKMDGRWVTTGSSWE